MKPKDKPSFDDDRYCFCCGEKNPLGLKLKFSYSGEKLVSEAVVPKEFQGFKNLVHGGVLGTLLDEMMVNLYWLKGEKVVSVEFQVRLKAPCPVSEKLLLSAWPIERKKRLRLTASEAKLENGTIVAEATAKCLEIE